MTTPLHRLIASAALALLLAGCGQQANAPAAPAAAPAAAPGPRVVALTADDTMKYSVTAIPAAPGEDLQVALTNLGSLPKESMAHNWVLLKAGADAGAFSIAAISAKDTGYLPPALQDEVLAQIPMQGPHQTGEVEFKAPVTAGDYVYLCTFPAHYQVGMKGVLTVK
jgi:azurin